MSVGDLQNNLNKLISELRHTPFDATKQLDLALLRAGDPVGILPVMHYVLLDHSCHVARFLVNQGYKLYASSDRRFVEGVYRIARNEFSYRPSLTLTQFLATGFAERKIIFLCDLIKLCKRKHDELERHQKEAKNSRRRPDMLSRARGGLPQCDNGDVGATEAPTAVSASPSGPQAGSGPIFSRASKTEEVAPGAVKPAVAGRRRAAAPKSTRARHGDDGKNSKPRSQRSLSAPPARPVLHQPKNTPVRARWADGMKSPVSRPSQSPPPPASPPKPLSPTRSATDLRERRGMERWVSSNQPIAGLQHGTGGVPRGGMVGSGAGALSTWTVRPGVGIVGRVHASTPTVGSVGGSAAIQVLRRRSLDGAAASASAIALAASGGATSGSHLAGPNAPPPSAESLGLSKRLTSTLCSFSSHQCIARAAQ